MDFLPCRGPAQINGKVFVACFGRAGWQRDRGCADLGVDLVKDAPLPVQSLQLPQAQADKDANADQTHQNWKDYAAQR